MYQSLTVVGNVGNDPEFRFTPQGVAVCDFRVAVNKTFGKGDEKRQETTWFKVTVWRERAETIQKYVKKGMLVMCVGEVKASAYIDKQGKPAARLELTAYEVKFLSKSEGGDGGPQAAAGDGNGGEEEADYPF